MFEGPRYRILLVNGPNLNLLGEREPEHYGRVTLAQIVATCRRRAAQRQAVIVDFQSNHEGAIIDFLHRERRRAHGLVINPGAYTHTSYAIRDAITACRYRAWEVHLSDLTRRAVREPFRAVSVIADVCEGRVMGRGARGYLDALDGLLDRLGAPPWYQPHVKVGIALPRAGRIELDDVAPREPAAPARSRRRPW
ncbi:MAG: 3-dehydroquinate dehydratase [Planctomycetota bacterium]|nr:MAG: 3-dehydroquinate dehydratase [Planctomycetota bacterium]